jgi:acyl-coenzyme A synthetase/AMP-(fatty) acid ligase
LSLLRTAGQLSECSIFDADKCVRLSDLTFCSSLGSQIVELRGRSVMIATRDQLPAALAMVELDGLARRLVICPPDLTTKHISLVAEAASVDAIVSDRPDLLAGVQRTEFFVTRNLKPVRGSRELSAHFETEWILLTSGTTGAPKLVAHTLASLTGAITVASAPSDKIVWSTFYDVRRYGGLQVLLRSLLGRSSLILSSAREPIGDFLIRAGAHNVTHILGTPSHWRAVLMSPSAGRIVPRYVRLSGEIVDQPILDRLGAFYRHARIVHAFASTEAGVGFEVGDGRAGFPSGLIGQGATGVDIRVAEGSLRIRSTRIASGYVGSTEAITDRDGFVDTGDIVALRGNRYYFVGRRDGVINVGGVKFHPEEVEAVINRHPDVRLSLVKARRNPITGWIVVADIVVAPNADVKSVATVRDEIIAACGWALERHKIPVAIRFVPSLNLTASGKLARLHA